MEIYSRQVTRNIESIIGLLGRSSTQDELLKSMELLIDAVIHQDDDVRWNRVMVMAAARHRPELWSELGRAQAAMNLALAEQIEELRSRGLVTSTEDARELALFVQFSTFGRIFRDLDPSMGNEGLERWRKMLVSMHRHFVLGHD